MNFQILWIIFLFACEINSIPVRNKRADVISGGKIK